MKVEAQSRRTDCIFCGAETGSKEHTFPAGLGGRRVNKGILCGECNGKFSQLDSQLVTQLSVINGMLGVRGDHSDDPKPVRVESPYGPLLIDHEGKPSFAEPRQVHSDPVPEHEGRKVVGMEFADEGQLQQWLKEQREAGLDVKQLRREQGQRFLFDSIPIEWSFGGDAPFREIGRIALNFLAQCDPTRARSPELAPFKEYVLGTRRLAEGDYRYVWYARQEDGALPDAQYRFGHQVLITLDSASRSATARVRFFSTFDLVVWFGRVEAEASATWLWNIDPLAEHPPHDIKFEQLPGLIAAAVPPANDLSEADLSSTMGGQMRRLMEQVTDLVWSRNTAGLVNDINACIALGEAERVARVFELLEPHKGWVLQQARHVIELCRANRDAAVAGRADMLAFAIAPDRDSPDGLSPCARHTLGAATRAVAAHIAAEIGATPIDEAGLRQALAGVRGATWVAEYLDELANDVPNPK